MQDWIKVLSTPLAFKADMLKSILEENGINAVEISKQDSTLLVYGEIEIYVSPEDAERAAAIIAENKDLDDATETPGESRVLDVE